MSSAFESEASFPVLLAAGDTGSMWAMAVGVSSRRKRLRNPPVFFLSFSATASGPAGCCAGGAHSSVRDAGVSCCGASGPPHGSAVGGAFGLALGAQALAGVSVEAGGGVVHDVAGLPPP